MAGLDQAVRYVRSNSASLNEKHSCCWQTARRLCTPMLCCQELPSCEWLRFIGLILRLAVIHQRAAIDSVLAWFSEFYLPISHLMPSMIRFRGCRRAVGFVIGMEKQEWLGYNILKVALRSTQSFGHSTATWQIRSNKRDRHTDRHVAIANAALRTGVVSLFRFSFAFPSWLFC